MYRYLLELEVDCVMSLENSYNFPLVFLQRVKDLAKPAENWGAAKDVALRRRNIEAILEPLQEPLNPNKPHVEMHTLS